jgi:hypothetical protein
MPERSYITAPLPYNADINLIASVPDLRMFSKALAENDSKGKEEHRTARTTNRLERVIRVNLMQFFSKPHHELIQSVFATEKAIPSWHLLLFWQLALTNRLVYEILDELFFKYYFEGRGTLPKQEIIAYLKEKQVLSSETGKEWSASTLERIASKLLTFLKRLELMEGSRIKHFRNVSLSQQDWALFCYLLDAAYGDLPNVLEAPLLKFSFASREVFIEQVKKLALKGYLDLQYDGEKMKLKTKYPHREIAHVLYH